MMKKRLAFCAVIFFIYMFTFSTIACSPTTPSTTEKNCAVVHKISHPNMYSYEKQKQLCLNYGLFNLGNGKQWNGVWVMDADFIRCYVEKYSAEELFDVYDRYIARYMSSHSSDPAFYKDNNIDAFCKNLTETTDVIFSMTDLFTVVQYDPASDTPINTTSETDTVTGEFNVGSDNHIETGNTTLTTDMFYYDGYYVRHDYGQRYSQGQYEWRNGSYHDVKPYFYSVDEWSLFIDGEGMVIRDAGSLEDLSCRVIVLGDKRYYERKVLGYHSGIRFSEEVRYLTTETKDLAKHWLKDE